MSSEYYTRDYYEVIRDGSARSAQIIVPLVLRLLPAKSVVDVGCGEGAWLAAFQRFGVNDVFGLDGEYIDDAVLQIPRHNFKAIDLAKPFTLDRTFDLAMSLEVAEHLPPESAASFVNSLTRLAPAILFSAAVPFQGGNHHINERWPDEWAKLFKTHNYVPVDFIRKQVWENEAVEPWYAQNTILFARTDLLDSHSSLKAEFELTNQNQLRLIHPRQYLVLERDYRDALTRAENPGVREAVQKLLASLKRSIGWRFGRTAGRSAESEGQPKPESNPPEHVR